MLGRSPAERNLVRNTMNAGDSDLDAAIEDIFKHSWDEFHAVEVRLLSLCCAWRRMCHEKLRAEREGSRPCDGRRMSRRDCKLFWDLIPARAGLGVPLIARGDDQGIFERVWESPSRPGLRHVSTLDEAGYLVGTQKYGFAHLQDSMRHADVGYGDPRARSVSSAIWSPDLFAESDS